MITRDSLFKPVLAFDRVSFDASCVASTDFAGHIINRLGTVTDRNYTTATAIAFGLSQVSSATTTVQTNFMGIAVRLQHSSTTCTAGFADYSTQYGSCQAAFINISSATSTASLQPGILSSAAASTATSTVNQYVGQVASGPYDLTAAQQYIRIVVTPFNDATSCASVGQMELTGALLLGGAAEWPARTTSTGVLQKS